MFTSPLLDFLSSRIPELREWIAVRSSLSSVLSGILTGAIEDSSSDVQRRTSGAYRENTGANKHMETGFAWCSNRASKSSSLIRLWRM